ncbi:glycosyltransferase family 4 protein [Sphingomonas nostoxanthinifaciens]|uniref:glycosyltransferase family 4 protein n=1 Tax=Sphingomonas nostoxanthinifaciens TaxID=2872652 RepID=UPI001CC1DAB5|nr:glycosyltransferase family 4 protein [Sphingomonas nostoxanthinifaciens]UAK24714.1 glycosyltransferase family 4 protein [Sphingomonas nostoxanthinifaciens]
MAQRLRVLVIAEAANPEWVSVPLVGWSQADALRAVADVHIVTQIRNRDAFLRAGLVEGTDFTAIDSEKVAKLAWRATTLLRGGAGKGWTTISALASLTYFYFERLVWRQFGDAIRAGRYDVVHRLTPLSPTSPSPIAPKVARAGAAFVLGPLNGGLPWPKGFNSERHKEREWLSYVRGAYKLLPGYRATLAAARVILAGSRHTAAELPASTRARTIFVPENGIDPARFALTPSKPIDPAQPIGLCFIGRLVPYKGPDMALAAALPLLRAGRATFDMIGDGPMMAELRALAEREGVSDAVRFHGWVEHDRVQAMARASHWFVFPSVREFGGGAVLEAMALGLLAIVVDYGGPGELVADGRGIALPLGSREAIVAELSRTLLALADDPARAQAAAERGHAWVEANLTWAAKARVIERIYRWALDPKGSKPEPY